MEKIQKEELVEQLGGLNEVELFSIFYAVMAPLKKVRDEHGEIDDAYCISFGAYSDRDGEQESYLWALPKGGFSEFSQEQLNKGATQFGKCPRCKALITCVSKFAVCPICSTEVDCT